MLKGAVIWGEGSRMEAVKDGRGSIDFGARPTLSYISAVPPTSLVNLGKLLHFLEPVGASVK